MDEKLKKLMQILFENIEADAPDIVLLDKIKNVKKRLEQLNKKRIKGEQK